MSRALADLVAYAKQYMRNPTALFLTLAFPLLLLLIFGTALGPQGIDIELHVQDVDASDMSRAIVEALSETGVITVVMIPPDEDLEAYIIDKSLPRALLIPEGFQAQAQEALAGDPGAQPRLVLYGDPSSEVFQAVEVGLQAVVTGLNFDLYGATPIVSVESKNNSQRPLSFIDFFLPGVIGITVLIPLFATSTRTAEYRERRYFKLLATTPLRKGEFLLSRTIWLLGLTFVSTILMIIVAFFAFGAVFILTPISLVLITAGTVLFVSMGVAIGNLAKDSEAATAVANIVYFPMMFLSGTFFPVEIMPGFVQVISRALPLTYFNDGLRDTLIFGNVPSALTNLAIVTVLAVVMFVLASWSLRWKAE